MPYLGPKHLRSTATVENRKRARSEANDIESNTAKKPRIENVDQALQDYGAAITERSEEEAKLRARQADELDMLKAQHIEQTNALQVKQT